MSQDQHSLALLGGSFDPIHYGHIKPALEAAKKLHIDSIQLLPNRVSPLKSTSIGIKHKLAMLKLVTKQYPEFAIDDRELRQQETNYTVQTLKNIRKERPTGALSFIMGYDSLVSLPQWHQWQHLLNYAHLIICQRPAQQAPLPTEVNALLTQVRATKIIGDHGSIILLNSQAQDISSTDIRSRIKNNKSIKGLLPKSICQYISENSLYLDAE